MPARNASMGAGSNGSSGHEVAKRVSFCRYHERVIGLRFRDSQESRNSEEASLVLIQGLLRRSYDEIREDYYIGTGGKIKWST